MHPMSKALRNVAGTTLLLLLSVVKYNRIFLHLVKLKVLTRKEDFNVTVFNVNVVIAC